MHQQALATLILRIIGFIYFFFSLGGGISGLFFEQTYRWNNDNSINLFAIISSFLGIQLCFGLALMLFAHPIARLLFPKDAVLISAEKLSTETLIRAAVPLMGLFLAIHTFPKFIYTAYLWFLEQAHPTSNSFHSPIESQFIQYTILMIITVGLILRNRSISNLICNQIK